MNFLNKPVFSRLIFALCFLLAYSSIAGPRNKALEDVLKRRPNLEFKDPKKRVKGSDLVIKIPYIDSQDFGKRKKYIAIYDQEGNWIYDKVGVTANIKKVVGLEDALIKQGLLDRLVHVDQIITPKGVGYDIKVKTSSEKDARVNEMIFLDGKFRRVKYNVGVDKKLVNKAVLDQLHERYGAINVLESWNYDKRESFFVTFQCYSDDTRFWARSFYNKEQGWTRTELFYRDYLKLPIELFSFVADKGGIENFHHIMKEERKDGCEYYRLRLKDQTQVTFNEELHNIDPETCEEI